MMNGKIDTIVGTHCMTLNRTIPPSVRPMDGGGIVRPERRRMKNGMPLNIIQAGSQEVVRLDILVGCGHF